MDLEEHTVEHAAEYCQECGVRLTDREMQTVLEAGGPPLCTVHAAEVVPLAEAEEEGEAPPA
jgi:hypothetical protein